VFRYQKLLNILENESCVCWEFNFLSNTFLRCYLRISIQYCRFVLTAKNYLEAGELPTVETTEFCDVSLLKDAVIFAGIVMQRRI
jgi:hypothetical protein